MVQIRPKNENLGGIMVLVLLYLFEQTKQNKPKQNKTNHKPNQTKPNQKNQIKYHQCLQQNMHFLGPV
jgi:hypothetical protein